MKELIIIIIAAFILSALAEWLGIWDFVGGFLVGVATAILIKMRQYDQETN